MTLYSFKTYSHDHYLVLSDTDYYTVEEVFRKYLPEEYDYWDKNGIPFSFSTFSRIKADDKIIPLYNIGNIDIDKMEKDTAYFSDSFNTIII